MRRFLSDRTRVVVTAGFIAGLVVVGLGVAATQLGWLSHNSQFELDTEGSVFALVSGAILLLAAALFFSSWRLGVAPRAVVWLTALFVLMGLDEVLSIHERLEFRTGIDWQILYAPVFVAAAGASLAFLRHTTSLRSKAWFIVGGMCWAVSQILEALQWNGDVEVAYYEAYHIPEEFLEIIGSFSFLLAGFILAATAITTPVLEASENLSNPPLRSVVAAVTERVP